MATPRVLFDTVVLSLFLHPDATPPKGLTRCQARIQQLIDDLAEAGGKILIPTPVMTEFLLLADAELYLPDLEGYATFEVLPFDKIAAIEAAALMKRARVNGSGKRGGAKGGWQKVKIDWQLVAIARVHHATCIYSDDDDVIKLAAVAQVPVVSLADLPVPPPEAVRLPLDEGER
jgi:hypothetical protein